MNKGETVLRVIQSDCYLCSPVAARRTSWTRDNQSDSRENSHWEGLCSTLAMVCCTLDGWLPGLGGWYKGSRANSRESLTPASSDAGSDSHGSIASADEHPLAPTRYLEYPGYCRITLVPPFSTASYVKILFLLAVLCSSYSCSRFFCVELLRRWAFFLLIIDWKL